MRLKRSKSWIFAIAIYETVFLTGCSFMPKEEEALAPPLTQPKKQEYQVFDVKKTDITRSVNGNGNLISTNERDVFVKENGKRIKKVDVKFGDTVKKGDVLIELDSGDLENALKLERLNLQREEINHDRDMQSNNEYVQKLADINLQIEKLKLQQMEEQLAATKLTAPVSGKIDFLEEIKEGDVCEAYKTLATIADPGSLQVVYQPSGAINARTGLKAQLKYSGKEYEGVLSQMPDSGKYKNNILIMPNSNIEGAKLGDNIEVSIILETKKGTLVVPKAVVKDIGGTKTVEVMEGDRKLSIDVETGIENSSDIEILSGLKEGQKVILR